MIPIPRKPTLPKKSSTVTLSNNLVAVIAGREEKCLGVENGEKKDAFVRKVEEKLNWCLNCSRNFFCIQNANAEVVAEVAEFNEVDINIDMAIKEATPAAATLVTRRR
ncbi:hypothetical protein Ancab_012533 [Ancistrocladus abbreviatus]